MKKTTLSLLTVVLVWCAGAAHRRPAAATPQSLPARSTISVVTLNMAKETDSRRMAGELRAHPELGGADILVLQEVKDAAASDIAGALGLEIAQGQASNSGEQGLAILSRYPLSDFKILRLPEYGLMFHSRLRFAIAATAMTPAGPIRIFDTHLDTRLNASDRLHQIGPVLREAAASKEPALIGGDFNSNSFYWLGHVVPVPVWRSQAESICEFMNGRGYRSTIPLSATTFDYLGMHLDWIWGRGLRLGTSSVVPLDFSDHHAVLTRVAL